MSLYPLVIHREEKSVEEKFRLDAKVKGEAEKFKKKLQRRTADVSFLWHDIQYKDIFRFSFIPRTITEWNKLPQETVSSQSLCIFKSKLN